ncbi:LysR family transcriptional regulator [Mitsuokella jalaludinii]|uniref:LysR family transcriptional regulator n=1 Tax=Mitsuokella jalaludinii TaxID=187979 RepID=UPI003077F002
MLIIVQQDMRYVYEIYRQKSFSKAAQALFITQPALSIAIGKLEASLGMPLFDRSTRPISLTPAGRIYLQTIEQTRALEQDLRHQLDDIRALRTGTITIGSSHFINACILPEVLTRFNRQFPQVKLNLLEGSSHAMARMLEQREIDLTFSCDEAVIQDFTSTPVFTDTILLAVPQDVPCPAHRAQYSMTAADILADRHLAPDCPSVDLKDFAAEPFILLRSGNNLHDRAIHFFREAGIKPTVKMELSQMATASRLAEAGFAATFLSDHLVTGESHLHFYRLSHPESHRTFHALTSPKRYLPAAVKAFIDCLK